MSCFNDTCSLLVWRNAGDAVSDTDFIPSFNGGYGKAPLAQRFGTCSRCQILRSQVYPTCSQDPLGSIGTWTCEDSSQPSGLPENVRLQSIISDGAISAVLGFSGGWLPSGRFEGWTLEGSRGLPGDWGICDSLDSSAALKILTRTSWFESCMWRQGCLRVWVLPASRLLEASCKSGPNLEKRGFGRVSGRGSFKRHLQLAQDLQGGWFAWYASATCGFPFSFVLAVCLSLVSTVTICSEKPRKLYMFGQGDEVFRSSFPPKPNWNYIEYLSTRASQSCVKSLWQRRARMTWPLKL